MKQNLCDECRQPMSAHDNAFMQKPHRIQLPHSNQSAMVKFTVAAPGDYCANCLINATVALASREVRP